MEKNDEHILDYYKRTLGEYKELKPTKSYKMIMDSNKDRLDNIAMSEDDRKLTYAQLFDEWFNMAKVLTGYDMTRSDKSRILALMPNVITTNALDYGADITGAEISFVDPTIDYETIKKYIEKENITDIVASDLMYAKSVGNKSKELKNEYGIRNIIVCRDNFLNSQLPKKSIR